MRNPGGKNGSGVYQKLISLMPPHSVNVEPFLGSGAVMRIKKPASFNIANDADVDAVIAFSNKTVPGYEWELMNEDALDLLARSQYPKNALVYCDPPYLFDVRSSETPIYKQEFGTVEEHTRLLSILLGMKCVVLISGYESDLYNTMLSTWRKAEYFTTNRAGRRVRECVWMNFPAPTELHDAQFVGCDYNDRWNLTKMKRRLRARLDAMDPHKRQALFEVCDEFRRINGINSPSTQIK